MILEICSCYLQKVEEAKETEAWFTRLDTIKCAASTISDRNNERRAASGFRNLRLCILQSTQCLYMVEQKDIKISVQAASTASDDAPFEVQSSGEKNVKDEGKVASVLTRIAQIALQPSSEKKNSRIFLLKDIDWMTSQPPIIRRMSDVQIRASLMGLGVEMFLSFSSTKIGVFPALTTNVFFVLGAAVELLLILKYAGMSSMGLNLFSNNLLVKRYLF